MCAGIRGARIRAWSHLGQQLRVLVERPHHGLGHGHALAWERKRADVQRLRSFALADLVEPTAQKVLDKYA